MKKSITNNLKKLRLEHGFNQGYLADYLHVDRGTYRAWESGERSIPSEYLIRLHDLYAVSIDYLLGLSDYTSPARDFVGNQTGLSDAALQGLEKIRKRFNGWYVDLHYDPEDPAKKKRKKIDSKYPAAFELFDKMLSDGSMLSLMLIVADFMKSDCRFPSAIDADFGGTCEYNDECLDKEDLPDSVTFLSDPFTQDSDFITVPVASLVDTALENALMDLLKGFRRKITRSLRSS